MAMTEEEASRPLTADELCRMKEAARICELLPGLTLEAQAIGRYNGDPDEVWFKFETCHSTNRESFKFYELGSLRRYVLCLARKKAEDVKRAVDARRELLDRSASEARACEALIADLERELGR